MPQTTIRGVRTLVLVLGLRGWVSMSWCYLNLHPHFAFSVGCPRLEAASIHSCEPHPSLVHHMPHNTRYAQCQVPPLSSRPWVLCEFLPGGWGAHGVLDGVCDVIFGFQTLWSLGVFLGI